MKTFAQGQRRDTCITAMQERTTVIDEAGMQVTMELYRTEYVWKY